MPSWFIWFTYFRNLFLRKKHYNSFAIDFDLWSKSNAPVTRYVDLTHSHIKSHHRDEPVVNECLSALSLSAHTTLPDECGFDKAIEIGGSSLIAGCANKELIEYTPNPRSIEIESTIINHAQSIIEQGRDIFDKFLQHPVFFQHDPEPDHQCLTSSHNRSVYVDDKQQCR